MGGSFLKLTSMYVYSYEVVLVDDDTRTRTSPRIMDTSHRHSGRTVADSQPHITIVTKAKVLASIVSTPSTEKSSVARPDSLQARTWP